MYVIDWEGGKCDFDVFNFYFIDIEEGGCWIGFDEFKGDKIFDIGFKVCSF